jgi:hypothetical protein
MNDLRTAAQQALEALEDLGMKHCEITGEVLHKEAYAALRAALAQQEPMCVGCEGKPTLQNSPCAVCGKIAQQEQEPAARVIDDGTLEGSIEWIPYSWRRVPLKAGDLLYTHPPRRETEQEPVARMHEDGSGRVINQRSYAEARRDGGASWSSVKNYTIPLYTHPPRREWVSLTDEEMVAIAHRKCWEYRHSSDPHHSHTYKFNHSTLTDFRCAIEAALKEKNHD